MRSVLAIDLDQTLIYSYRSAGDLDGVETVCVEACDGAPLSLMTRRAHDLLADLQRRHHVIPVTTRTPEQFARIRLPGPSAWAITCNGGILLRDGDRDVTWDARVRVELSTVAPASEAAELFRQVEQQDWVRSWRQVEHLFVYLVAENRDRISAEWVSAVAAWGEQHGWTVSVQGRKAYAVPHVLSKGAAALRVAEELRSPLLAAGDSLLDRDLLQAACFSVRPAHGELHRLGYDDARVTSRSGACAAEDVLVMLGQHADAPPADT